MRGGAVAGVGRQAVAQVVAVVALGVAVQALVRAARLLAVQRRVRDRLRHVELVAELDRQQPFGVPGPGRVVEAQRSCSAASVRPVCRRSPAWSRRCGRCRSRLPCCAPSRARSVAMRSLPSRRCAIARRGCLRGLGLRGQGVEAAMRASMRANATASMAGDLAEHQQLGERIGAQPVGAMDADAGALADRVQARPAAPPSCRRP